MGSGWFETVAEAERRAKKRLPKSVYWAVVAGSEQGATLADFQPQEDVRVCLDPAGHPFCLFLQ